MLKSWRALLSGLTGSGGSRDPLRTALGSLERQVMDVVWRNDRVSVRDVRSQLGRPVAYTTVMTTLDRLFKKGLLERVREGRAFMYHAAVSRNDLESAVASGLLRSLLDARQGGAGPVLSHLVEVIGDRDDALLAELERLVREKRRQGRQR
jgi:predicted transcriptional regulator